MKGILNFRDENRKLIKTHLNKEIVIIVLLKRDIKCLLLISPFKENYIRLTATKNKPKQEATYTSTFT